MTIGGVAATDVVVESATAITAKTAARTTAGAAEVAVSVSGRTGTLFGAFTYVQATSTPAVITSIAVRGTKFAGQPADMADLDEEVTVTATVEDPDTSADALTFEWTAESGTFTGTGASVRWRAPASLATPAIVKLTLAVTDIPGQRVTRTTDVRVHDAVKEVGEMARQFLLDFSDSRIPASQVMRNFATTGRCQAEYESELSQVERNRRDFLITSSDIRQPNVNVAFGTTPCAYAPRAGDACAVMRATWFSDCLTDNPDCKAGQKVKADGTDYVTAVYEQSRWRLCASYYEVLENSAKYFMR